MVGVQFVLWVCGVKTCVEMQGFVLLALIGCVAGKECTSVDFRNSPIMMADKIAEVQNCTAVLGFFQVVLMETTREEDFVNMVFPELREVTGFLLFYRAFGLRSIGQMFPNLQLVRGHKQLYGHSIVIYEMPDLVEIGLTKLHPSDLGSVRIEKNPRLCDVDKFDWVQLTHNNTNVIGNNGKLCQCQGDSTSSCGYPARYQVPTANLTQSACDAKCEIGCTEAGSPFDCIACKDVKDDDECVNMCPEEK